MKNRTPAIIPLLENFMKLGIRHFCFVQEFVGVFDPPRLPHKLSWTAAQDHWEITNNVFLSSDLIPTDLRPSEKVKRGAVISAQLLWPLAILGLCPRCDKAIVAGMTEELGRIEFREEL